MAKEKKRLSKNAKAALKLLNDSKLLADAKINDDAKDERNFKSNITPNKSGAANKIRPDKKRG